MKSVILDLDEDLTDEQIDKIIDKLKSKKKVVKIKPTLTLTDKETKLIKKIELIINDTFGILDYDNYKGITGDMRAELNDVMCNNKTNIEEQKECIHECQEDIKDYKKEIIQLQKEDKELKEGHKLIAQLEKLIKGRTN